MIKAELETGAKYKSAFPLEFPNHSKEEIKLNMYENKRQTVKLIHRNINIYYHDV